MTLARIEELLGGRHAGRMRGHVEVLEHKPPRELVASRDLTRRDALGRTVVACPKGQPPAHWLTLTPDERASLVPPAPPLKPGTLIPGRGGFTPYATRMAFMGDQVGGVETFDER